MDLGFARHLCALPSRNKIKQRSLSLLSHDSFVSYNIFLSVFHSFFFFQSFGFLFLFYPLEFLVSSASYQIVNILFSGFEPQPPPQHQPPPQPQPSSDQESMAWHCFSRNPTWPISPAPFFLIFFFSKSPKGLK